MGGFLSLLAIASMLASAVLASNLRERSIPSRCALILTLIAASASAVSLVLNKSELAQIKGMTSMATYSLFGGL